MVQASPTAAINAPHRISVRGDARSRGIRPHCAASVADAPAIMTIEIGPSEPRRRKMQAVDDEESEASQGRRLGMAGNHAGDDPGADARIVPFQAAMPGRGRRDDARAGRSGGQRRIAHRRAAPDLAAEPVVGKPQQDRSEDQQADRREGEQRPGQPDERKHEQRRQRGADDRPQAERG